MDRRDFIEAVINLDFDDIEHNYNNVVDFANELNSLANGHYSLSYLIFYKNYSENILNDRNSKVFRTIEALLKIRTNPNQQFVYMGYKCRLLHMCLSMGYMKIVELLVKYGADIDTYSPMLSDKHHFFMYEGNVIQVSVLTTCGINHFNKTVNFVNMHPELLNQNAYQGANILALTFIINNAKKDNYRKMWSDKFVI